MSTALVFSGQGSQYVGMGQGELEESAVGRATFEEADDALGFSLSRLVAEGPQEKLTLTENAQPAILTFSIALLRLMRERVPDLQIGMAAGHSLGEYSALVAAESLAFDQALRLVRLRGQAMQEAVPAGVGGMMALGGVSAEVVAEICQEAAAGEILEPAGFNSPVQVVIAGHLGALKRAQAVAEARGVRRCIALNVSAPFHCSLLSPAAERLSVALADTAISTPRFPVFQNVEGRAHTAADAIRRSLVEQVRSPVQWTACVQSMRDAGASRFLEVGPGRALSGLLRKIDRHLEVLAMDRSGALESLCGP